MIDQKDVQGFILRGYGKMRFSRNTLLRIDDKALAAKWLGNIANSITNGTHYPETTCLNLAITYNGLKTLGMNSDNLRNFSREFREGMATPHRQRLLGDEGASRPDIWRWGGKASGGNANEDQVHILLMSFGKTPEQLADLNNQLDADCAQHKLTVLARLDSNLREDSKEHFGFRDGIAQPIIAGIGKDESNPHNVVAAGEFLMGYKNEYGVFPDTPFVSIPQGDMNLLPSFDGKPEFKSLGKNGSYLVYRQMEQDVDLYWEFLNDKTKNADGSVNEQESTKLASKMMGRWPSGAPLALYPDKDPGGDHTEDIFGYSHDRDGARCPYGAHIRRSNPRDAFEDNGEKLSLSLTKKHRIIRRGRSYGEMRTSSPTDHKPVGEVGLHFMCFNSDISHQFEFIQHTWSNFPRFQNLYNDPDPITGVIEDPGGRLTQNFTVQGTPVNKCITGLQRFVHIRGGAYFFFPSVTVINYLASL